MVSGDAAQTAHDYNCDSVDWKNIPQLIDEVKKSGLVLLGGGGIFHDQWFVDPGTMLTMAHGGIPYFCGFATLAEIMNKPLMIFGAGVGPIFTKEDRDLTAYAFKQANTASVRDVESKRLLKDLGIDVGKVEVTADPAHLIVADIDNAERILSKIFPKNGLPLVAACLRNWDFEGDLEIWQKSLAAGLDQFIEQTPCNLVFIPFHTLAESRLTDDLGASKSVRSWMRQKKLTRILDNSYPPEIIAGVISQCQLVFGIRLHSVIMAANAGVPVVGLAYDTKVKILMSRLGMIEYSIEFSGLSKDLISERLNLAWSNREKIQECLKIKNSRLANLAKKNFDLVDSLISRGIPKVEAPDPAQGTLKWVALKQTRSLYQADLLAATLKKEVNQRDQLIDQLSENNKSQADLINSIADSRGWRLLQVLWNIRLKLIPHGSRREKITKTVWRFLKGDLQRRKKRRRGIFRERYVEQENSVVTVYAKQLNSTRHIPVSLIAAVKNETEYVDAWLASVAAQTVKPSEIIITDTGSTDDTVEKLTAGAKFFPVPIRILSNPGANIAQARNKAITEAQCKVIAVSDFGTTLSSNWLQRITYPFLQDPETKVSAGIYKSVPRKKPPFLFRHDIWPSVRNINPQSYLPPGGSIAFKKEAWSRAGGYPEWLTMTGEDTYFDLELKKLGGHWAIVPDAVIHWQPPKTGFRTIKKMYAWAVGDGESGVRAQKYRRYFSFLMTGFFITALVLALIVFFLTARIPLGWLWAVIATIACILGIFLVMKNLGIAADLVIQKIIVAITQVFGFFKGASHQREIQARRFAAVKGIIFMLAGMPIDDSGGGSRGAQFANEFLSQGYAVVYIHKYPKFEKKDLKLPIIHPNLFHFPLDEFALDRFVREYGSLISKEKIAAIVEFPLAEFLPVILRIKNLGGKVIYDLMDDWQTSLGENWYVPKNEEELIRASDILAGSAENLCAHLEKISGKNAVLVPNAVNDRLFNPARKFTRPGDLPNHGRVITYIGALWGEWLDWDLLFHLAQTQPKVSFCVIGDYRHPRIDAPQNMHFLGLKPQVELPAYLAYTDVAIIPWKKCKITESTSPLKLYEYLAMGCPVVAPDLPPLRYIPGVSLARDQQDFVDHVNRARRETVDQLAVSSFINQNNWQSRTHQLLELLGFNG